MSGDHLEIRGPKDEARKVAEVGAGLRTRIRAELAKIKPGTTQCPGRLSRNLGSTLRELRPTLEVMERRGEMAFYQNGRRVKSGLFRGRFGWVE